MAVIGNTANEIGDQLIIKIVEPYTEVSDILSYEDEVTGEDTNNYFAKYFRWSTDNVHFSEFIPLSDLNLAGLTLDATQDFWIEYLYEVEELVTGNELEFVSIALETVTKDGILQNIVQVDVNCECDSTVPSTCGNLIIADCCGDNYNPYGILNAAHNLYDQLTEVASDIFGHCVTYWKVDSNTKSRDTFFKEYSLHGVAAKKEIKVLVPDNEFPTNAIQFNILDTMGFDEFEIHLTRSEFQSAFGALKRPEEGDFLYFPLIQKMYSVNSVALSDEIHYMHAYYRIFLKKYEERASIDIPEEFEADIEELTQDFEEVYGEELEDDFAKSRKPQQYNTIGMGDDDFLRSELDSDVEVVSENINNNWTIVSKNYYDMTFASTGIANGALAVKYREQVNIESTDDQAYTMWFKSQLEEDSTASKIADIAENGNGYMRIELTSAGAFEVNDIVTISGSGSYNGIHRVRNVMSSTIYVLDTIYVEDTSFTPTTNSKMKYMNTAYLMYGYNTSSPTSIGMFIQIIRGYMIVNLNNTDYVFDLGVSDYDDDTWYSVVVNLNNKFSQLGAYLYKLDKPLTFTNPQAQTTELEQVFKEVRSLPSAVEIKPSDGYSLITGDIYLTNVRVFRKAIEEEDHSIILNQYVVRDTQYAILVDNATPRLKLPKFPNPR